MYKFIAALSVIIRTFYLPNPFEAVGDIAIPFMGTAIAIPPIVINYLAAPILHVITYGVVGLYYTRHKNSPTFGSFLYLVFFCIHVGLLYLMAQLGFAAWAVVLILIVYAMAHIGFNALKNRVRYGV